MDLTVKFQAVDALVRDRSVVAHHGTGCIVDVTLGHVITTITLIRAHLSAIHNTLVKHKHKWFHYYRTANVTGHVIALQRAYALFEVCLLTVFITILNLSLFLNE